MPDTRKYIIAFWVFIGSMLAWQFYSYNKGMDQAAVEHPKQTSFIFLHTNAPAATFSSAHSNKADVQQTSFVVQQDTPSTGNFTCLVTLKNVGVVRATGIQICVRPYRGVSNYDEDVGHQANRGVLSDDDPLSQFNSWLSFPDMDPGQSITRPISFLTRPEIKAGLNPTPQILFENEKSTTTAPAPTPVTPAPAPPAPQPVHHGADS
jgi:hypothetical protein